MRAIPILFAAVSVLAACGSVDPWGDLPGTDTSSAAASKAACGPAIAGEDPTLFPPCTGTKGTTGRCVPTSGLGTFADTFEQASCNSDAACLPDELIKEGSAINLKKCVAVLNGDGRCFWPLAKQVLSNYDLLAGATKGQCDPDQVCAPCVHPVTHQDTGVCDVGANSNCGDAGTPSNPAANLACPENDPILDPAAFQQLDCTQDMYCVDPTLITDAALANQLAKCSQGVCAPSKSVLRGGMYIPKTCKSTAGAEGRCSNVGVPNVAQQKAILPQDVCDADELCAPCFDPRDGSSTGACNQAPCDAPKEPATTFAACCQGGGHCVPSSAVPASSQSMLGADSCTGDTPLCAPNELIPMPNTTPKQCAHTLGLLPGICVSKCALPGAPLQEFLQADCDDDQLCAPCSQLPAGTEGCN